jgi:hypothetical protein
MAYQFEPSGKIKVPTAEELAASDADSSVIVLSCGAIEDGTPYWAYISVKPSKYQEFMRESDLHKPINFDDYGVILKCGLEEDVPDSIKEEMKREHGVDENYLARLRDDVLKAQATFLTAKESKRIGDIVAMLKKKQPKG